jgi:hypothetical protein
MQYQTSKALAELLYGVSKTIQHKSMLITKKQSLAVLEATRVLWNDVYQEQILSGQEAYFSSNLNGINIDSENVADKLSQMIVEISNKDDAPYIGQFWGRNLEVLSSTFEGFKYSSTAGKLIEPYLDDLVEITKI